MVRCIDLAKKGLGKTYPNPLVGSVVIHNNTIIGEGWHHKAGEPHAEVNAIRSVKIQEMLAASTLYVNLEPCSHHGKTPPCADLIINSGIKKVVIGTTDPDPRVSGKGIERLRAAGCEVVTGVMEDECVSLNKRFFCFQREKRPYIFLKWARTADGFIAPENREVKEKPVWITNKYSRQLAHKIRSEEQAILVGTTTVLDDNPSLTTRMWAGRSPLRVVLDRALRIPAHSAIFDDKASTLVLTEKEGTDFGRTIFKRMEFGNNLATQVSGILGEMGIQSLIVEGGRRTLQAFIDENIWDEALVFTGNKNFNGGITAPQLKGTLISEQLINGDKLQHYKNQSS